MGTPAPDIFKQQRENNFTGTATLSVLDGEGIFGGEYKYVYYFFKKPPTFISSTNVVTLNLFGIPDKNIKEKGKTLELAGDLILVKAGTCSSSQSSREM